MALRYLWNPRAVGTPELSCATAVTFARVHLCGVETAIAFAGEKWAFLLCFLVAVVMVVSTVAVQGCAVVTAVSCWPASVIAAVAVVAPSRRHRVQCAKKFALRSLLSA